jgi:hypothetical protein
MKKLDDRFGRILRRAREAARLTPEEVVGELRDLTAVVGHNCSAPGIDLPVEQLLAVEELDAPPFGPEISVPLARILGLSRLELFNAAALGHEVTISSEGLSPAKRRLLRRLYEGLDEAADEDFAPPAAEAPAPMSAWASEPEPEEEEPV